MSIRSTPVGYWFELGFDEKHTREFEIASIRRLYVEGRLDLQLQLQSAALKDREDIIFLCVTEFVVTDLTAAAIAAASVGNDDMLRYLISLHLTIDLNRAFIAAVEAGIETTIRLLKKMGATDFDAAMVTACISGKENIFYLLRDWIARDLDHALLAAITKNHLHLVRLIVESTKRSYGGLAVLQEGYVLAAGHGYLELMRYLETRIKGHHAIPNGRALVAAATSGFVHTFRIVKSNEYLEAALIMAAKHGHTAIVTQCIYRGAKSHLEALKAAAANSMLRTMKQLLKLQSSTEILNALLLIVAQHGTSLDLRISEYLLYQGADNLEDALVTALNEGHRDMSILFWEKGADVATAQRMLPSPLLREIVEGSETVLY